MNGLIMYEKWVLNRFSNNELLCLVRRKLNVYLVHIERIF